jgi:hypothetical protein
MAQAYINPHTTDLLSLKSRLLPGSSQSLSDKFDALNLHLRHGLVTPGQMVIIPEEYGVACTANDAWLMRHAQEIRRGLEQDASAGTAVIHNYDLLQSWLGYGSLGVGSTTSAWARHLDGVKQILEEVERLHQQLQEGKLDRNAFIQQRQGLFQKLDAQLQGVARLGTSLRTHKSLKKILGISTKSYLHKSEIVGYTQRIRSIAETSRFLGKGTYVGLVLDVGAAGLAIKEACMDGRETQCEGAKFVETGRLVGGVGGAAWGGKLAADKARELCVSLRLTKSGWGALSCAIIGGATGGLVAGTAGGAVGEQFGEVIYEVGY